MHLCLSVGVRARFHSAGFCADSNKQWTHVLGMTWNKLNRQNKLTTLRSLFGTRSTESFFKDHSVDIDGSPFLIVDCVL